MYLEVQTAKSLRIKVNIVWNPMRENLVMVSSFPAIIHNVCPCIQLCLKEWNK
jgi:hypothetical protein